MGGETSGVVACRTTSGTCAWSPDTPGAASSSPVTTAGTSVDLVVHEALSRELVGVMHEAAVAAGRQSLAKITDDILDYHASPVEAAEIAEAAGAGHLLFYHVVPPLPLPGMASVFLDGVSGAFSGGVTLGRDGTQISLPAGSRDIVVVAD
jgi:ribonuclease Z